MNRYIKRVALLMFVAVTFATAGCDKDKYAELNTSPSNVTEPDLRFVFTSMLSNWQQNYTEWFYNNMQYYSPWMQMTSGASESSGNTEEFNVPSSSSIRSPQTQMSYALEIREYIDNRYDAEESESYQQIRALTYPVVINTAINYTDVVGSFPYTEAMQARYDGGDFTVPYDTQEELYTAWLEELDAVLVALGTDYTVSQVSLGSQDYIYGGDIDKWMRLCNSLKLKIASRLVHQDIEWAKSIAEEVVNHSAGFIDDYLDDALFYQGPDFRGIGSDLWVGYGGKNLIDFLVENRDPRVRFFFAPNGYSDVVIQQTLTTINEAEAEGDDIDLIIPDYIMNIMQISEDGETFEGWTIPEEFARFHGAPTSPDAVLSGTISDNYWNSTKTRLTDGDSYKTYLPASLYNEEFAQNKDYTYPNLPADEVVEDTEDWGYTQIIFTSGESYLYLAELKLYGADLPQTAEYYLQKGVENSINIADKVAGLNHIPYYDIADNQTLNKYGPDIKLQDGEIETLLEQDAYSLTGDQLLDLEKVYVQQYIHFLYNPGNAFRSCMRGGIPKFDSTVLPREDMTVLGVSKYYYGELPRRFEVNDPEVNNLNYDYIISAYDEQGLIRGTNDPATLNSNRLWYDTGAPQFGDGPLIP